MPEITRKGVTLSDAYQEAAAVAPIERAVLYCYELSHPLLAEPIRFVNDKADLFATLEADAPRDAGLEVEFIACPLDIGRPEESDTAVSPEVQLSRPDVSGLLQSAFDTTRGSLEPWSLIERVYASDDTSGPAVLPPLSLELVSTDLSGAAGRITAAFDDDAQEQVPRITFKRSEYPGLKR